MAAFFVGMAGLSGVLACLCFYLISKHQQVLERPLQVSALRWIGLTAFLVTYGLLCCAVSPLTAAYMFVLIVMAFGSLVPFAIAVLRKGKKA